MAGSAEPFDEKNEYDFLKPKALPKAGATAFKVEGDGIPAVDLNTALKKEASPTIDGAAPLRNLDDLDSDLPPEDSPTAAPAVLRIPEEVAKKIAAVKAAAAPAPKAKPLFSAGATTAEELDRTLIDKYGIEWLEWVPETIWKMIREDWDTQISKINKDKVMAAQLLHVSDEFWRHWEVFHKVVLAFNNVTPLFDRVQDVSVAQIIHAIAQAHELRKEEFQDEILYYIANQAKQEGLIWLPPSLEFAQKALDELNPDQVATFKIEIRERWEALEDSDLTKIEFGEDLYGVHLAKLAAIDIYLATMAESEPEGDA